MKSVLMQLPWYAIAGLLMVVPFPVRAALIVNGSFETPAANATWVTISGGRYPFPYIIPPGWQGTGEANVYRPSLLAFPAGVPDGLQAGAVGSDSGPGTLFQDVSAVLMPGTTYSLSAFIGSRADAPGSGMISLRTVGGGVLVSSGPISPLPGAFQQVTLTYTAFVDDPRLGEGLRVFLERTGGHQASFDSIQLEADTLNAVPEPASLALWSLGALGMAMLHRRRRNAANPHHF